MNIKKLQDYSDTELKEIMYQCATDGYVLLHDQKFTKQGLVDVSRRIGDTNDSNPSMGHMQFNPKDIPDVSLITSQPTGTDPHGMFGPSDLLYHHDFGVCHFGEFKELLTGLYCVGSCPDTILSLMNTQTAFNHLSEEEKDWWRGVETQLNQGSHGIYGTPEEHDRDPSLNNYKVFKHTEERQKVINIHPYTDKEVMIYQPAFLDKAWHNNEPFDIDELKDKFWKDLYRGKNVTDFVLREGDFLICDQLLTLHRRSWVKSMNRMIWRTAFDYTNILGPNKSYDPEIENLKVVK
jgi:alpha-ketoglutarate-dependent taurine dioxygenase|tara:strand:+ start:1094 stop:1972 length:879 start_codon:yes stop_codon:yes gene_type:complete